MRLCAALALVLVALITATVKVTTRPRRHAPPPPEVAEPAPLPPAQHTREDPLPPPLRAVPRMARPPLPTAKIAGTLHRPDDVDETPVIRVRPTGSARWDTRGDATDSTFVVGDLVAGQRYDVDFGGARLRTVKLIGIVAPAADLDVRMEARAVVSVAVGFPRGERCPVNRIMARRDGADEWTGDLVPDRRDCRFEFRAPVSSGHITIAVEEDIAHLEADIVIPEHGDPDPVCLNPPCRANPLEGQANLHVVLAGAGAGSPIHAVIVPVGDETLRFECESSIETCYVDALPPGQTFSIAASGRDCGGGPVTATLVEGDNLVSIPCIPAPLPIAAVPDPSPPDLDL